MTGTFQRARSPEQVAARRSAILDAARTALAEKPIADISLRELGDRVGLAKSNVLRYFDSREAIYLEVLDEEYRAWLARLRPALGTPKPRNLTYRNEVRVAAVMADTLVKERLLCELLGAMAGVLERNISAATALDFKGRALGNIGALADIITEQLPWLSPVSAALFAEGSLTLVAGMYPFSVPTDAVRQAMSEIGMADAHERFVAGLHHGLVSWLVGAAVAAEGTPQAALRANGPARPTRRS